MKNKLLTLITAILIILSLASVQALTITSVSTSPDEIAPGETAIIKIEIENDGEEDIEDVSVSLVFRELIRDSFGNIVSVSEIPFAPYDSSSEVSFDEIRENKDKIAEFKIIALSDAETRIYKIPLEISYREDNETKTKNSLISITVSSEPIIGVSVEDGLLLKGKENEISVKVINKGLSDIKFLEVEIGSSTYFSMLSQKNVYIGNIDSDDFDSADFKIFFKENAPNLVNLPVSVTYKDALNNKYEEDFNLQTNVYTRKKAIELGLLEQSRTTTYVGVVVVLVIGYIVYRKIKKRRKMKKAREVKED